MSGGFYVSQAVLPDASSQPPQPPDPPSISQLDPNPMTEGDTGVIGVTGTNIGEGFTTAVANDGEGEVTMPFTALSASTGTFTDAEELVAGEYTVKLIGDDLETNEIPWSVVAAE